MIGFFCQLQAQVATEDCVFDPGNQYQVTTDCSVTVAFYKEASFVATFDPGGTCNGSFKPAAYGWFIATSPSTTISYGPDDPNSDVILHVYDGACSSANEVACVDDNDDGHEEFMTFPTTINDQYMIRVENFHPTDPTLGRICIYATPLPPAHDEPCGAIFLPATDSCITALSSTTTGATFTSGFQDPGCFYGNESDVWYSAVVPSDNQLLVDTYSPTPGIDAGIAFYQADDCNSAFTLIDCNDTPPDGSSYMPSLLSLGLTEGDSIFIRFWYFYFAEGTFSICASPNVSVLPVELIAWDAQVQGSGIHLAWSTASERNSDHFIVERSGDNSEFTAIGTVPAAGDAQTQNTYGFYDAAPLADANFYRLQQVDRDGTTTTTATVIAFFGSDARPVLFPNPASDMLHIAFTAPNDGTATVEIIDALGRTLDRTLMSVTRGPNTLGTATDRLAPGYYTVRIKLADGDLLQGGGFLKR